MLSYQHHYHAGNMADVHKHAVLASALSLLVVRDKPLSYLETHAGRGLYRLDAPEALKTGEAAAGIARAEGQFDPHHPYIRVLRALRMDRGPQAYPGSPIVAAFLLRPSDPIHLAELHPAEHVALTQAMAPFGIKPRHQDGLAMANAMCPPMPRRGMLMIDPSYEVKTDFERMPPFLQMIHRKWNVGVLMLWFPLLDGSTGGGTGGGTGETMAEALMALGLPRSELSLVRFGPARPGHRMVGSGVFVANAPWGLAEAMRETEGIIARTLTEP